MTTASTIQALVIDDSRVVRSILREYLMEMGMSVLEAENGALALDILAEHADIKIVLVDWNMPVMDGLQFITAIRHQNEYADLKIVMVTTESEKEQIQRAMTAGANEYVMKPFTKEVLEAKHSMLELWGDA